MLCPKVDCEESGKKQKEDLSRIEHPINRRQMQQLRMVGPVFAVHEVEMTLEKTYEWL